MMMRKRTNRCSNTVWDISVISRNKDGETLCGDQCTLELSLIHISEPTRP